MNDRLVNFGQMNTQLKILEDLYLLQKNSSTEDGTKLSALEMDIASEFIAGRDDKVFATKMYRYASNTTTVCEKMRDSVGLSATPSTNTVLGVDDFMEASQIFTWRHCNYTRDNDTTARATALEGMPNYRTSGEVDVGSLSPTFWWAVENHGTYDVLYLASRPHPELGLVPWIEAVKADGTVLPYYITSAYSAVEVNGKPYSQPNGIPIYGRSYNNTITYFQAKGTGYYGASVFRNTVGYLFFVTKYAYKSSQKVFAGCTSFNHQIHPAVAETGVKRVVVASSATQYYVGACVSLGGASSSTTPDRNNAVCHDVVNRAKIIAIENVTVNGTGYLAMTLDVEDTFDTTTAMWFTSMPCFSGETDSVIGKNDGSYLSNTDSRHTYRIKGIEYNWGQWVVSTDAVIEYTETDTERALYIAPKGVKRVANAHTNYVKVGQLASGSADGWIGDMAFDPSTGAMYPLTNGGGDSVGAGDRFYKNTGTKGTLREHLSLGYLYRGSYAGLCSLHSAYALSYSYWNLGSAD